MEKMTRAIMSQKSLLPSLWAVNSLILTFGLAHPVSAAAPELVAAGSWQGTVSTPFYQFGGNESISIGLGLYSDHSVSGNWAFALPYYFPLVGATWTGTNPTSATINLPDAFPFYPDDLRSSSIVGTLINGGAEFSGKWVGAINEFFGPPYNFTINLNLPGLFGIAPTPPSVPTLAALSNDVYGADQGANGYTLDPGYVSLGLNGTAANVYQNGNQIVIAVRGTDLSNESHEAYNLLSDASWISGTPNQTLVAGVEQVAALVAQVHEDDASAQITLTGHSLGGAIAQIVGDAANIATTTFDAPGPAKFIPYIDDQTNINSSFANVSIPTPDSQIANYRLYGDQISLIGTPINSTLTTTVANPLLLAGLPTNFLSDHDMALLSHQLNSGADESPGATGPDYLSGIVFAAAHSGVGSLLSYGFSVYIKKSYYMLDPPPGATYSLIDSPDSPLIASMELGGYGDIAGWEVSFLSGGIWSPYTLSADGVFNFGPGASAIDFYPVDDQNNEILNSDPFIFGLSFESVGDFSATLDVQGGSPVSEPASLAVFGTSLIGAGIIARRRTRRSVDCTTRTRSPTRRRV